LPRRRSHPSLKLSQPAAPGIEIVFRPLDVTLELAHLGLVFPQVPAQDGRPGVHVLDDLASGLDPCLALGDDKFLRGQVLGDLRLLALDGRPAFLRLSDRGPVVGLPDHPIEPLQFPRQAAMFRPRRRQLRALLAPSPLGVSERPLCAQQLRLARL
jgi:hypothetical protein